MKRRGLREAALFLAAFTSMSSPLSASAVLADAGTAKKKPPIVAPRVRTLGPAEAKLAIRSLMAKPSGEVSKDPSCQSDLSSGKAMTVADAMAETLVRATTDGNRIALRAQCFARGDYPLKPGEEYCRIAWIPANAPKSDAGYGLLFIMNWQTKAVDPGTVECY